MDESLHENYVISRKIVPPEFWFYVCNVFEGPKFGHKRFFLKLVLAPRDIPPKIRNISPKSLVFLGFERHTELFAPHPLTWNREEKSVHNHHQKKIFWRTFLTSKKNFPGRWWIQKPYKNQEKPYPPLKSFLCGPHFFFCKEKFCTGAGRCMVSFSQWKNPTLPEDTRTKKFGFGFLFSCLNNVFEGWGTEKYIRCANAQPFLCNDLGPFQAISGNFRQSVWAFSGDFRQF